MLPKLKILKKVAELLRNLETEVFLMVKMKYIIIPNQKTDNRQPKD